MPEGSPKRGSRALSRGLRGAAVFAATSFFLLVVAEVGLRLAGHRAGMVAESRASKPERWAELIEADLFRPLDDPVRRYGLRPGVDFVSRDGWRFRIHEHGGRGARFPREKPAGERRLLALGDSYAFGMWCDEEETVVAQLARLANAEAGAGASPWRAVNLAVPGYHTGQMLEALRAGLALEPDLVVLYFNTNDLVREGFFYDEELQALRIDTVPLPQGLRRWLWSWSHSYGALVRALTEHHSKKRLAHLDPSVPWAYTAPENQAYCKESLRAIDALCRQAQVPLFMIHMPMATWSANTRRVDWKILPLVEEIEELREELEIPGVNLTGWFRGYADGVDRLGEWVRSGKAGDPPAQDFFPEAYFADESVQAFFAGEAAERPANPDFHLTGAGYASIAALAYRELVEAQLLP